MTQKIKLEDYSLISNDVLDRLIKESNLGKTITTVDSQMATSLKRVKEQLIPSRLFAEKCFDMGMDSCKGNGEILENYGNLEIWYNNEEIKKDKQYSLNSEIEL